MIEKCFRLKENNTCLIREIIAGFVIFMSSVYIIVVNPQIISSLGCVTFDAIYVATALSVVIGTLFVAFIANLPFIQAPAMGCNTFFVFVVCSQFGFTYANALVISLFDGVLFAVFTITGFRKRLTEIVPNPIKISIPLGIGLFLIALGLQYSSVLAIESNSLFPIRFIFECSEQEIQTVAITLIALISIIIMERKKVKGSFFFAILGSTALYYLTGFLIKDFFNEINLESNFNLITGFNEFYNMSFGKVFTEGFDFSQYLLSGKSVFSLILIIFVITISYFISDIFDTLGSLYTICNNEFLEQEKKTEGKSGDRLLLINSASTCANAILGTTTSTPYLESLSGIGVGGRTGITGIVVAVLFSISLFFSPVARLIPACAYAPILIYIGMSMAKNIVSVFRFKVCEMLQSLITIVMLALTCNITYALALGFFTYVITNIVTGNIKKIHWAVWVITLLLISLIVFNIKI